MYSICCSEVETDKDYSCGSSNGSSVYLCTGRCSKVCHYVSTCIEKVQRFDPCISEKYTAANWMKGDIIQLIENIEVPGRSFRRLDPSKSESVPAGSLPPDSGRNCTGNIRPAPDRFQLEVCRKPSGNDWNLRLNFRPESGRKEMFNEKLFYFKIKKQAESYNETLLTPSHKDSLDITQDLGGLDLSDDDTTADYEPEGDG
ncbi:unnamed protein product [Adineta ricciae]|uniref:Uncharacterized protein n=1 Tax=Adineta ricciae TaxID=249248 RepID=A0A815VLL0_ADIRI|nr:unnamed protein product [Adineta ricciae]CAF1536820.1 unnamed protein product [Adineta ricciae]